MQSDSTNWIISVPVPSGNLAFDSLTYREQMAYIDCRINLSDHQLSGALSSELRTQRMKTWIFGKSVFLESSPPQQ